MGWRYVRDAGVGVANNAQCTPELFSNTASTEPPPLPPKELLSLVPPILLSNAQHLRAQVEKGAPDPL
jgi:hypothetical protein